MSSKKYDEMIEKDLELMWAIQEFCYTRPQVDSYMARIVSKYPWQDICIVLWALFAFGIVEIGASHFWVCSMNLSGAFLLRQIVRSKRPIEYDRRLKPLTDLSADSFGFPTLECHMSMVIAGHYFMSFKSILVLPMGVIVVGLVGFSRLYSRARFPHQVVGSWLTGVVGLVLSMHCCQRMAFHAMDHHDHYFCVGFMLVGFLAYLGLSMESNDSRLLYIPKSEFVRVIGGIIQHSESKPASEESRNNLGALEVERQKLVNATPRAAAAQLAMERENELRLRRGGGVKRDSFYFLQQTLERREREKQQLKSGRKADLSPRTIGALYRDDNAESESGYYNKAQQA